MSSKTTLVCQAHLVELWRVTFQSELNGPADEVGASGVLGRVALLRIHQPAREQADCFANALYSTTKAGRGA